MAIDSISRFIVKTDKFIDYIPFVSIANNAVVVIAKIALAVFSSCFPSMYKKIQDNALIDHLGKKSVLQCIGVAIPFLNILVALCRDFPQLMVTALEDRPSPADQRIAKLKDEVDSLAETLKRSEELRAQAKQEKRDLRIAELEKEHNEILAKYYDADIAACPDTDIGRKRRERLVSSREQAIKLFESSRSAASAIQRANGV